MSTIQKLIWKVHLNRCHQQLDHSFIKWWKFYCDLASISVNMKNVCRVDVSFSHFIQNRYTTRIWKKFYPPNWLVHTSTGMVKKSTNNALPLIDTTYVDMANDYFTFNFDMHKDTVETFQQRIEKSNQLQKQLELEFINLISQIAFLKKHK